MGKKKLSRLKEPGVMAGGVAQAVGTGRRDITVPLKEETIKKLKDAACIRNYNLQAFILKILEEYEDTPNMRIRERILEVLPIHISKLNLKADEEFRREYLRMENEGLIEWNEKGMVSIK